MLVFLQKSLKSCLVLSLFLFSLSACFNPGLPIDDIDSPVVEPKLITLVALDALVAPSTDASPVTSLTNDEYTAVITWSPELTTFAPATQYTASVTLSPKEGWTLEGLTSASFTHTGTISISYDASTKTLTLVFAKTAARSLSGLQIDGIAVPKTGEGPTSTYEHANYSLAISWSPDPASSFEPLTVYTASMTLVPKAGYTLSGVLADSIKVAGAQSVTHAEASGNVTVIYPKTALGIEMISVPAGRFLRDSNADNVSEVSTFYMSKFEVSRANYRKIMGVESDKTPESKSAGLLGPVSNISWTHAMVFCNKLSLAEGLTPVYAIEGIDFNEVTYGDIPHYGNGTYTDLVKWVGASVNMNANGYRLPTEMEWRWAAMGAPSDGRNGAPNTTGYLLPFAGSTGTSILGDYAVFGYGKSQTGSTLEDKAQLGGSKVANALGIFDLSGNLAEFSQDTYREGATGGSYAINGTKIDYYDTDGDWDQRVLCGGSWSSLASDVAVGKRVFYYSKYETDYIGIRLVRR